jgi:hypothetical protein
LPTPAYARPPVASVVSFQLELKRLAKKAATKKARESGCVTAPPRLRHQITELSQRIRACFAAGATMENNMVADAALWVLLAAAIILLVCGCHLTRPVAKVVGEKAEDNRDLAA